MTCAPPLPKSQIKEGKLFLENSHPHKDVALVVQILGMNVLVFHSNANRVLWNLDAFRSSYGNLK